MFMGKYKKIASMIHKIFMLISCTLLFGEQKQYITKDYMFNYSTIYIPREDLNEDFNNQNNEEKTIYFKQNKVSKENDIHTLKKQLNKLSFKDSSQIQIANNRQIRNNIFTKDSDFEQNNMNDDWFIQNIDNLKFRIKNYEKKITNIENLLSDTNIESIKRKNEEYAMLIKSLKEEIERIKYLINTKENLLNDPYQDSYQAKNNNYNDYNEQRYEDNQKEYIPNENYNYPPTENTYDTYIQEKEYFNSENTILNELDSKINNNKDSLNNHTQILGNLDNKINNNKDSINNNIHKLGELDSKINNNKDSLNNHTQILGDLDNKINNNKDSINNNIHKLGELDSKINNNKDSLNNHTQILGDLDSKINNNKDSLNNHTQILGDLDSKINNNKDSLNNHTQILGDLDSKINNNKDSINNNIHKLGELDSKINNNKDSLNNHTQILGDLDNKINNNGEILLAFHQELTNFKNDHDNGFKNIENNLLSIEKIINSLKNKIEENEELYKENKNIIQQKQDQINILDKRLTNNENDILKLKEGLTKYVKKDSTKHKNRKSQQITQGSYPQDIQTTSKNAIIKNAEFKIYPDTHLNNYNFKVQSNEFNFKKSNGYYIEIEPTKNLHRAKEIYKLIPKYNVKTHFINPSLKHKEKFFRNLIKVEYTNDINTLYKNLASEFRNVRIIK
ncbi:Myosin family protein [Borrelia crocidurae DOU]|uniref:Myosin family protein n=2 Tax=Borrelia crocidurae TaxID=29520 RepID=W5SI85_9SPIR|nr:Myosin family protein [Borrelia crocidurae DOU]